MSTTEEYYKKIVEIPKNDMDRFTSLYPSQGAWTWFVREALRKFVALHETSPNELIELAVSELNIK